MNWVARHGMGFHDKNHQQNLKKNEWICSRDDKTRRRGICAANMLMENKSKMRSKNIPPSLPSYSLGLLIWWCHALCRPVFSILFSCSPLVVLLLLLRPWTCSLWLHNSCSHWVHASRFSSLNLSWSSWECPGLPLEPLNGIQQVVHLTLMDNLLHPLVLLSHTRIRIIIKPNLRDHNHK